MPEKNDSPNGLLMDGLCMGIGVILGVGINYLIRRQILPQTLDYLSAVVLVVLLILIGVQAIQKSKKVKFTPILYATTMTLFGWLVGIFIFVELYKR